MFRKLGLGLMIIAGLSFAGVGDLSLYSSLTGSGTTMGGIRVDLGGGMVTDLSATMTGSTYSYFADVYSGLYGLAVAGDSTNSVSSISLMFAAEQAIAGGIVLGIAVPLLSLNQVASTTTIIGSWDVYGVLSF
jgi:hypothetical protein